MSRYGEVFDSDYNPAHQQVYEVFSSYFENPLMIKLKEDSNGVSFYYARIHCMLGVENRYLIALVPPGDRSVPASQHRLSEISWFQLHISQSPDEFNVPVFSYIPKKSPPYTAIIQRFDHTASYDRYSCQGLPITVTIRIGSAMNQERGTLCSALETFRTVIAFAN